MATSSLPTTTKTSTSSNELPPHLSATTDLAAVSVRFSSEQSDSRVQGAAVPALAASASGSSLPLPAIGTSLIEQQPTDLTLALVPYLSATDITNLICTSKRMRWVTTQVPKKTIVPALSRLISALQKDTDANQINALQSIKYRLSEEPIISRQSNNFSVNSIFFLFSPSRLFISRSLI